MNRILIEGLGGIGGVVAGKLCQAGLAPVMITANPAITEAVREQGLQVETPEERFTARGEVYTRLRDLPAETRFEAALLVMKATGVVEAARETLPWLEPQGVVVTCQNGIVEDAVAEVVGRERVIAGIIGWGGTMHGPGRVERTGPGAIHLGELDGRITGRVEELARILRLTGPVVVTANIRGARWAKLAINCTITTLGALTGQTLGEMLGSRPVRDAFLTLYREVIDTAEALGIKLEKIAANPGLLYLPKDAGPLKRWTKDLLARVVGRKYGKLKSSSLQSLERGKKTEIDFLNGYVVGQAHQAGVPVPANEVVVRLIHEIEAGQRPIRPQNLEELLVACR
jgi:2-dehydropantoate 2-reductase